MARSGFRLVETLGEDDSSEATWKLSSENEQDSRWVTRVWIELRLVLANLQSLGELGERHRALKTGLDESTHTIPALRQLPPMCRPLASKSITCLSVYG